MTWLRETSPERTIHTNPRQADILGPYFDLDTDRTLPLRLKLDPGRIRKDSLLYMEEEWHRNQAQMAPLDGIAINERVFSDVVEQGDLIYSSTSGQDRIYLVNAG